MGAGAVEGIDFENRWHVCRNGAFAMSFGWGFGLGKRGPNANKANSGKKKKESGCRKARRAEWGLAILE